MVIPFLNEPTVNLLYNNIKIIVEALIDILSRLFFNLSQILLLSY